MERKNLSRTHLESLSSADLIALADDYGIDVPDDLNRRFIIGELLEIAEELRHEKNDDIDVITDGSIPAAVLGKLPESFNETQIGVLLRNPVWAFVYWDIKEADSERLSEDMQFLHLIIRVSSFADEHATAPSEVFDMQVSLSDREQYVLLPPGKRFIRIDLLALFSGRAEENLAVSRKVIIPTGSALLRMALPGRDVDLPPLVELSSMKDLLRMSYELHRESFSL